VRPDRWNDLRPADVGADCSAWLDASRMRRRGEWVGARPSVRRRWRPLRTALRPRRGGSR
jgi:hypothetical protein